MSKSTGKTEKITIPLRRPYGLLALSSLFFAGCAAVLWHQASANDRGLVINGLIHLEADSADVFYAVLTALSLGFVGLGLLSIYGLYRLKEFRVVLGKSTLKLPPGRYFGMAGEVSVPLAEIRSIETHPPVEPQALVVVTEEGRFGLHKRVLPEGWSIAEIAAAIVARVREVDAQTKG